ncbi:MAG: response regulator [Deltaproteobacteria bacterium]|nr:response regulator [Deltaproteobacteria bacterium]MBW1862887.1 response regulator [Deltaproteobacteria bacterium]
MNILVVDDDSSIGNLLAEALKAEGYQTIICTHPRAALAASEQEIFELAFIDINLPDMSGLEVASKIKHHNPLCDVVFITGYGTFDNAVQAIKIGACDYLSKPFGISDLNLCLKRFQERKALQEKVKIEEKLKTLSAISAEVVHEIRNPIVSIGGFAKRLQKKSPGLRESEIILCESQRLEKILDKISNYLKPVKPCSQECSVDE